MDLKNGAITVGEVLRRPGARQILRNYFPQIAGNSLMLSFASGWTLNQVLSKVSGSVDGKTLKQVREELEKL